MVTPQRGCGQPQPNFGIGLDLGIGSWCDCEALRTGLTLQFHAIFLVGLEPEMRGGTHVRPSTTTSKS
jgi:hypothetical protein